jgi:hypothetical protein
MPNMAVQMETTRNVCVHRLYVIHADLAAAVIKMDIEGGRSKCYTQLVRMNPFGDGVAVSTSLPPLLNAFFLFFCFHKTCITKLIPE